ncbi:hypothetical protein ACTI_68360 [Actinoplanes sp. OR16]|uniref:hypothetical protein n=1 Tax=Actinoplanes sp. OR16 TaxID=946334 RepID=UPI000F6CC051|nr:hypothetical protein [Actinoplanes sp. OR16]BBH70151.1 hypothetical protein ACTI_68360 [Actinoplanes sp. OR16]
MSTTDSGRGPVIVAIIAALAAIVVAVIGLPATQEWIKKRTCDENFAFTVPSSGQIINGNSGISVTGTTCRPGGDEVGWLFEFDHDDRTYYSVSERPLDGEQWGIFDRPIGDPGDDHKNYRLVIVEGGDDCNRTLIAAVDGNEGWTSFPETAVPAGCRIGPGRDIVVNRGR